MLDKKNIFLWTLYDFANSVVIVVFVLYFSQWLVVEKGVSDFWYNAVAAIGSALLLITAPILGSIADKNGKQQNYLNQITVLSFLFFTITSLGILFFPNDLFLIVLLFLFANYFYQFSFVFYNALLSRIAPPDQLARISGMGQAGNWLGQIAGLLFTLPFASGAVYLFGEVGRAQTFLPATLLFILLALPMMLFFKLPKEDHPHFKVNLKEEYRNFWFKFKDLISAPSMGVFLLSYFFFNDAILTAANNFPIYLENVFSVSDTTKSLIFMGILVTSAIGAFFTGFVADKIGLKKSLMIILGSWVIIFPVLGYTSNFTFFVVMTCFMGFFFGATYTINRATMIALCPKDKMNFGFSFFTIAERVSTLVGPLGWGILTTILIGTGSTRYRYAVSAMALFVAVGIFFLNKVEIKNQKIDLLE